MRRAGERAAAWAAAVALLLAAGCTDAGPPRAAAPTTPPATPPASPTPTAAGTPSATPRAVVEVVEPESAHFSSPSGNIGCEVHDEGAFCDTFERDWPKPPRDPECDDDWGAGLTLGRDGRVTVGHCATDTIMGSERVLRYGHAIRVGDYRCASERAGVTCVHLPSGHGFLVSRARYRTF